MEPKNKRKGTDASRDAGGFIAMPWSVMDCPAYGQLSHAARALLWEVARQFCKDNNGRLLLSRVYMAQRGWRSADTIHRAKQELLHYGFIYETVKGYRPNKASWYAVTWRALDRIKGYDPGAELAFVRGAYRLDRPAKNTVLSPVGGIGTPRIGPPAGIKRAPIVPPAGAMQANFAGGSVPPAGHPLEIPSAALKKGAYRRLSKAPAYLFKGLVHSQASGFIA